ncbi:DUF6403 family protein [Amycolatopsis bartoniae]|nr:DUF6403 family protein [Amycolatopsis bartoniae]TVT11625.1 hypothetical protein FNH07_01490 [Amycolatopsis bartoniae]
MWVVSAVVLGVAGFAGVLLPRRRARAELDRTAWSTARAAVAMAEVSRDAAGDVAEAEQLLARAERMIADGDGARAAEAATEYARRADRLWREAARD